LLNTYALLSIMVEFAILFDHERPSLCCLLSNLSLGGQAKKMAWFLLFTAMRSNPFHVDPFLDSPSFSHMKGHYFPVTSGLSNLT